MCSQIVDIPFQKFLRFKKNYVYECFAWVYVYALCIFSTHEGEKKALDPLEESRVTESYNLPWGSWNSNLIF